MAQTLRTGPVRVSGYAIKLRRVFNAALREHYKQGKLDAKAVNQLLSDLNGKIYRVLVERFEIPKEAVVNIEVDYSIGDGELKIEDVRIDVYDRDEILSRNATNELKKLLAAEAAEAGEEAQG